MTRQELKEYIAEKYHTDGDMPWEGEEHEVFRHAGNKKWFALVMNIPKAKLGLKESGNVDILNVKCDTLMIGSFLGEEGFFPAYHMNKNNWITMALDGSADGEKIRLLLDMSYDMTAPAAKRKIKKDRKK